MYFTKALEISGEAISQNNELHNIPDVIKCLYYHKNGFFMFQESLVFPSCDIFENNNLVHLNKVFQNIIGSDAFLFVFNKIGDLFYVKQNSFYMYDAETGEESLLGSSLETFFKEILSDYNYYSGCSLSVAWQCKYGKIGLFDILIPKIPFVLGGGMRLEICLLLSL